MAQKKTKAQKRASELAKEAKKITKTNVASQSQSKSKSKPRVGKVSNAQLGDVVKGKPKTPLHPKQDLNVKDPPKKRVPRPPVQQPNPLDPGEARASDAWEKKAAKANKPPSTATKVASKASKAARLIPLARYATHPYVLGAAALGAVGYGLYKAFSGKSPQNKDDLFGMGAESPAEAVLLWRNVLQRAN